MKSLGAILLSAALLAGCSTSGFSAGDIVTLKFNSPSGSTLENYRDAVEVISNNEHHKLGYMMADGKMTPIDGGSKVQVVETDGDMIKVRLSDDTEWWLDSDSVE